MSKAIIQAITDNCMVSPETAQEIIEYRQKLKKPLTARAGRSIAQELAKCEDPEAAIDYWMNRGWQGFKHDWYVKEEQRARSTGNLMSDAMRTMRIQ